MITRADRSRPPGTAVGVLGTVVVHAAAAVLLFTHVQSSKASPPSYAVNLIAAPAPTAKKRLATEAPPRPPEDKPAPVKPKPSKPTKAPPAPTPKPQPTDTNKEPPAKIAAPVEPLPGETPSTGSDVTTIKTPGLEFPYPEYLRNIVNQVYRNWDRTEGRENSFAEVSFLILRDGSVRDIRFVTRSGNFSFDLGAQGAIEASGNSGAFGPLPDGWEADVLPVSFYFKLTP